MPLSHASGLLRFPVFWEDDLHWMRGGRWDVDEFLPYFLSSGLKIINVHPVHFALNTPGDDYYRAVKSEITSLDAESIERLRYKGPGTRSFILDLWRKLYEAGYRFQRFGELCRATGATRGGDLDHGRSTAVSDEAYIYYQDASDDEKQEILRILYNERSGYDSYATSRDVNLRELEIEAIGRFLPETGTVLDLGCGNGYTIRSLAPSHGGCQFIGVDFAESLIEAGRASVRDGLGVSLIACNALDYLSKLPSGSIDAVITERFLLNLPSRARQHATIADIFRALRPGGRLLMCEASQVGFTELNRIRVATGLAAIPDAGADNLSAIRFDDDEIEKFAADQGFFLSGKLGFSDYFIASRVLHPLMVAPARPRFDSFFNVTASKIQQALQFRSGVGSNVLWVLEKK